MAGQKDLLHLKGSAAALEQNLGSLKLGGRHCRELNNNQVHIIKVPGIQLVLHWHQRIPLETEKRPALV